MKLDAPRTIAVIGAVALIVAALGLGYRAGLPAELRAAPGGDDPAPAVRTALAQPNQLEAAAALAPILASVDARGLEAVVGAYEESFTGVGPSVVGMELLAEAWAKLDPAGAVERTAGWKPYRRKMVLLPLMRSWARRDLPAARAAVETIEPEKLRESAITAVILGWDDSGDPGIWDAYVAGLPFGSKAAPDLIQRIGASEGVDALLRRVEALPEGAPEAFRPVALRRAADFAARTDPERAAAFADEHRGLVAGLVGTVATRWAESDGPRATEWALSQPDGSVRERALRAAFQSWLRSDEQAALDWAGRQPDEVMAVVRMPYARALAKQDPQRALEISADIADPKDRRRLRMRVARSWLAREPEVAAPWLEQQSDLAGLLAANQRGPRRARPPGPPGGGKLD